MPALQASTTRRFLLVAPLIVLGSWVASAGAFDPDYRGGLAGGELAQLSSKDTPAVKPAEKRIELQKRDEPWEATLNWLAAQTGMGMSVPFWPEGKFSFISGDRNSYSIPEIVDILNEQLMGSAKPCILIRGVRQWRLIQLPTATGAGSNLRLDPALLPRVTKEQLKEHGETEI